MKTLARLGAAAGLMLASVSAAHAVPSLSFIVDGDTFTDNFNIDNTSDGGENLLRFFIDLTGTTAFATEFDTSDDDPTLGTPFTPLGGTDATTGLTSFSVVDAGKTLDILFNDFAPGETFTFIIDVDPSPEGSGSATISGDELIGATAFADFSDGQRVSGVFAAIAGNPDASGFSVTGITVTPAIPLPAPALLLLGGLGALGVAARRRS
jgi:hypothetical protein